MAARAPRRLLRRLLAGGLVGLVVVACGGGDGDDADGGGDPASVDDYSAALAPNLFVGDDLPVDDAARRCVAAEFVAALGGPEALEDEGITPREMGRATDLTELGIEVGRDEAERVAEALEPCGVSAVGLLLAGLDLPADVATCVEDNVDEAELRRFIVRTIVDEGVAVDDDRELAEPLLVCFPE